MAHAIGEKRVQRDIQASGVTAVPAVGPDHQSGPEVSQRDPLLDPDRHRARQAADRRRNPKAEAALERLKEKLDAKNQIRDETNNPKAEAAVEKLKEKLDQAQAKQAQESQGEAAGAEADRAAGHAAQGPSESESREPVAGRDPETGRFREGHQKLGGRVAGSKDQFPRNSYRAMKEMMAGRILKIMKDEEGQEVQRSPAEIMADAILEGMQGKLVISTSRSGSVTYANPLYAVKLFQDYMLKAKELALRAREAKQKQKGTGGGIRIVLPSVPADPLLKTRPETAAPEAAGSGSI